MIYRIKAGTECKVHSGLGETQYTYTFLPRRDRLFEDADLVTENEETYTFKDFWGFDTWEVAKDKVLREFA